MHYSLLMIDESADVPAPIVVERQAIVCDDHFAVRRGVISSLTANDVEVIGECSSLAELEALLKRFPLAIVIMDLGLDRMTLPELLDKLSSVSPNLRYIIYSTREDQAVIDRCYAAGAMAYIPKRADEPDLIAAVNHAVMGETYVVSSIASKLLGFHRGNNSPLDTLSPKEMEVFKGFAEIGDVEATANRLGVSAKSVRNRLAAISKKLGVPRALFSAIAQQYN